MALTNTDITPPALVPVTFSLYKDIHKAIRSELFCAVGRAGQTDPSDGVAVADLATQVARLFDFLELHAAHEDEHVQPAIVDIDPRSAEQIEADHEGFDDAGTYLVARAVEVTQRAAPGRRQLLHWLYLDLASFTSRYLAHQDLEERIVMPKLEAALGVDAVLGVHGQILGSLPPDEMMRSLALMIPAMNADDRTDLLGGMRATAPAPVFDAVWGLVGSVLSEADVRQQADRLGIG